MTAPNDENTFDYVIAGAGTAGCVLAARLSEDPTVRVCLLEAGKPDSHPFIKVPALVAAAISTPSLGWGYWTVPQEHMNGRKIPTPRGRVLGGCSSINGMAYMRGPSNDYDDWAAEGNTGWSYAEVLPYFVRSESNYDYPGSPVHGVAGPMSVVSIKKPNPLNAAFWGGMESLQYRRQPDFNGPDTEGYGPRQGTIRNGRRESEVTAYLRPAMDRPNLTVVTGALVKRVVVENKRATGVEVEIRGASRTYAARREVIVSGGAIGSPQILLLSGIGPAAELQRLGIPVAHDLPGVGRNYHDHFAISICMKTENADSYGISLKATPRGAWNIAEYLLFRAGPLAGNVFESTAFIKTEGGLDRPDIQLVFQPARRNAGTFPIPIGHGYNISVVTLYPKSRGSITLSSANPHEPPLIDPNLLSVPEDIDPLVRGLKIARRVLESPAFARYQAEEFLPGPSVQSDEELKEYIRAQAATVHHPSGSCKMGVGEDAVVDPQLKVHGMEGLRVVDASIFPFVMGGNTNAPVVMVAEKGADMILGRPAPARIELPDVA